MADIRLFKQAMGEFVGADDWSINAEKTEQIHDWAAAQPGRRQYDKSGTLDV